MLAFSADSGWKEIVDFLQVPDVDDDAKLLSEAGFSPSKALCVGDPDECAFCVLVYARSIGQAHGKEEQYSFLVDVEIGGTIHRVAVEKLPDLLELLRQTVPLAKSIHEWNAFKEKCDEKIERRVNQRG